MTITSSAVRDEYTANAAQTVFNYTFKIYADTDLNVYVTPAGQACSDNDLTTDYSVTDVGDEDGGTIVLSTPTGANDLVTISSAIPADRTVDYQNNGDFRPDTVNDDNDRGVSISKQAIELASRSLTFPECLQGVTSLSLDAPVSQTFLRWKSDLSGIENFTFSSGVIQNDVSVEDYDDLRGLTSSDYTDGQLIFITTPAISGSGVVKTGTVSQEVGLIEPFTDNANRYWQRLDTYTTRSDWTETTAEAYLNGDAAEVLQVDLKNGSESTGKLTVPTAYSSRLKGLGSAQSILSFSHTDDTQCILQETGGSDRFIKYFEGFKVQGGANTGHGFHFNSPSVGPHLKDIWVRDCSGSDKAGIKFTNTFIGQVDNSKIFSCDVGLEFERAKGIISRGMWNADNDIGIRLDDDSNGNDMEMIELGVSGVDANKVAIDCSGFNNKFKVQFYENYSSPRAIDFGPLSYSNNLELLNSSTLSIWDDGYFNRYKVTNSPSIYNWTSAISFNGQIIGSGALENQYNDSSFQDGASGVRWNPFGATAPTRTYDSSLGYLDDNSLELDWGTTALSGVESLQTWSINEDDFVSVMMMVRADRDLEATEQLVFKIHGAANENREVQFKSDLRAGEWTPVILTMKSTATESIALNISLDADATHTALVTNIDDIVVQVNKKNIGLLRNDADTGTRTFSKNSGAYIPKATFNQASVDAGSSMAAVPGILFVSSATQATTGTSEEALVTHNIPANALWKDGMGIRIKAWGNTAANSNGKQVRIRLGGVGGTLIADTGAPGANNKTWIIEATIIRTGSSAEIFIGESVLNDAVRAPISGTASIDLTAIAALVVTGTTSASAGDITYLGSTVELITKA